MTRFDPTPVLPHGPLTPSPAGPTHRSHVRTWGRRGAAVVLVAALCALPGCGIRVGGGSPASLPSASQAEADRDTLARHSVLIGSTAQVVASSGESAQRAGAQVVADAAVVQLEALGGVWEPWATPVPTTYPTATPVATAAATATTEDLATALGDGVSTARQAASRAASAQDARLYAALATAWSLQLRRIAPQSVEATGRGTTAMTEPLAGDLLVAYDAARYAMEEVGARGDEASRARALIDAAAATAVVSTSLALGGQDTRLGAYGRPEGQDTDAATDAAWAQEVWLTVMSTELAGVGASGGEATTLAIDAAVAAGSRAQSWGAVVDAPLPGHDPAA
ncbi:MAG: hypothetical protein Q4C85_09230 [Actinomyces sp.]|uniref:hypothetical protein n=1 Tax=Actinomyces sp. TaxID=29317 RepID=UPI0026DD473C|nr:hypothetical protein [Actinomyces sp.]MDO4243919.1 hypothetical protein [Actinomyces sp.]